MTTSRHSAPLVELYSVRDVPIFQNLMFRTEAEAKDCAKGDVVLVQDPATGLIFNRAFKPELMRYDANYQNEQATSRVFREHLQSAAAVVDRHFRGQSLIEVGCGKGHFLELLKAMGFKITGLDPSYEGSNLSVIKEYFVPNIGLSADGVILRHVLEHVQNPVDFLCSIRDANGGRGKVYIEVPCFDWICDHRVWFDIFYEHVNYFRLPDFHRIFNVVHDSGRFFAGQYLYVVADLASLRIADCAPSGRFEFPSDFLATVDRHASRLKSKRKSPSAVWGGASKGVIFTLFMLRSGAQIDVVIDINPAKHGKYLPVTGLKVRSPEQASDLLSPGADVFVMNGNYLEEIRESTHNRFNYVRVDDESI